jgi:hypothetical protein
MPRHDDLRDSENPGDEVYVGHSTGQRRVTMPDGRSSYERALQAGSACPFDPERAILDHEAANA